MAGSVEASTAPIMKATSTLTPKIGATTAATMQAVMTTPGKTSRPRPTAVREITRSEMPTPPMEEDHGNPDREDELGAHAVQGVIDDAEHRGADQSPDGHEHDHLGNSQKRRDQLRDQTGAENEAEIPEDVRGFHSLPLLPDDIHESLRERTPTQVLHAVAPHDFPAPASLLFWSRKVIR